jgi:hypothetical protein
MFVVNHRIHNRRAEHKARSTRQHGFARREAYQKLNDVIIPSISELIAQLGQCTRAEVLLKREIISEEQLKSLKRIPASLIRITGQPLKHQSDSDNDDKKEDEEDGMDESKDEGFQVAGKRKGKGQNKKQKKKKRAPLDLWLNQDNIIRKHDDKVILYTITLTCLLNR